MISAPSIRHPARWAGVAAVAVAVLLPIGFVVYQSLLDKPFFLPAARASLDAYAFVLGDPEFLRAARTSALIALGMVAIALPLGSLLAFLMIRTDLPGRRWIEPLLLAPIFVSSIVLAFGYVVTIGPVGFVSLWVKQWTGSVPWSLYSMASVIAIAGLAHVPHVYLYVSAALRNLNPEVEEAARVAGAGVWRAALTVSLPLVAPSLVFSGTLIYLLGIEIFGLILVLGDQSGIDVLTTYLYKLSNLFARPAYHLMAVVAVAVILLTLPLVLLQRYLLRSAQFYVTVRAPDGRVLVASSPQAATRLAPPPGDWRQGIFTDTGSSAGGLVRSTAFSRLPTAAGLVVIQVSDVRSDVDVSRRGMLDTLTGNVLPIMLPLMAAVLIIGVLTIRDSLAPMQKLARRAARISPTATDVRLPAAGLPPELKPMVVAINGALERLDEGFRMQREFTADAAHELRTPLAILATHLDSLENRQVATALRADVERMSRLVNQLLSVATLEALAVAPDEIADLQAIAVDVAGSLAPLALKRGRSLAVTGTTAAVAVRGNAEALRQALRNLIENALQHTPSGTEVEIEVTSEPAVHVSDRGPGVPPELRNRVVQRFWRADRRKGEGSGLGLAIVSRILAAHGGRLAVDDALGGGARFSLHLPAKA